MHARSGRPPQNADVDGAEHSIRRFVRHCGIRQWTLWEPAATRLGSDNPFDDHIGVYMYFSLSARFS